MKVLPVISITKRSIPIPIPDVGGTLAGGKGSELGTILGVFTVAIIENGMNFIGVNAYYQNIVFGIFVLAAIALTVDRSIRGQIVK